MLLLAQPLSPHPCQPPVSALPACRTSWRGCVFLLVSGATKTVERLKGHPHLGHLLSPRSGNSVDWLLSTGMPIACDNGAYSGLDVPAFVRMLDKVSGKPVLFVVAPDVVADATQTLHQFGRWREAITCRALPVAYVAQDGQEHLPVPWDEFDALFIGGTTEFKLGRVAESLAREARARGKLLHCGRVNTKRRFRYASAIGCTSVDGTSFSWFPDTRLPGALQHLEELDRQGWLL